MKKIIFTIMLAVSASLTASAQTFNEFFDEVVSNNVSTSFISKFMDQTAMFGKDENAKRYFKEQMLSDIKDIIRPYYESTMSTDDIKEMYEAYKRPEIKEANEHILASMSSSLNEDLTKELAGKAMSLVMGGKMEDIELKQGISNKYAKLCKEFCEASGTNTMLDAVYQSMPIDNKAMLNTIMDYIKSNIPTILANKFYGNVTTDDLKALQKLSKTSAYKHFNEGTTKFMSNLGPFAKELIERMDAWEEKNK